MSHPNFVNARRCDSPNMAPSPMYCKLPFKKSQDHVTTAHACAAKVVPESKFFIVDFMSKHETPIDFVTS
eukprot:1839633-Amphidinium_carterae.1